jgi:hypothetical protein
MIDTPSGISGNGGNLIKGVEISAGGCDPWAGTTVAVPRYLDFCRHCVDTICVAEEAVVVTDVPEQSDRDGERLTIENVRCVWVCSVLRRSGGVL